MDFQNAVTALQTIFMHMVNITNSLGKAAAWKYSMILCFSAGGRGKDGAPIIIFPEYSGFSEVPEEDFLNVVTYLTSIPRYVPYMMHQHCPVILT